MTLKCAAGILFGVLLNVAAAQEPGPIYVFSTLAGGAGVTGSADGTGAAARFKSPEGLGVDAEGNVYVADRGNSTVRKITPAGVVSTLAGKAGETGVVDGVGSVARFGIRGLAGLAVDGSGNVFVTDNDGTRLSALVPLYSVAVDALGGITLGGGGGTVLPPQDRPNSSRGYLRKISPAGLVSTLAGGGNYTISYDKPNNPTFRYSGAYDGEGTNASLGNPLGVTIDASGIALVVDEAWGVVRRVTQDGVVSTMVGNGKASTPQLSVFSHTVRARVGHYLWPLTFQGAQKDGDMATACLGNVNQIAASSTGAVWLSSPLVNGLDSFFGQATTSSKMLQISSTGSVTTVAGLTGAGYGNQVDGVGLAAQFINIEGMTVDRAGTLLMTDGHTVRMMTTDLLVITIGGSPSTAGIVDGVGTTARFSTPRGIAVDGVGNLYVADTGNHTIRKGTRATKPVIQTQPVAKFVTVGQAMTLAAAAAGFPEPTYQWSKNGTAVAGATGATLTLGAVQLADAGSYSVTATNVAGAVTSSSAVVSVGVVPVIATQPLAQSVAGGQGVTLAVVASGTPAPTWQWRKDGVAIPGATGATLTLTGATASDAGSYSVVVTNAAGSVTSSAAAVAVNTSRIVNLAIRSNLAAGGSLTVGFVVAGNGKALLVRGVGPALGQFGLGGVLADPRVSLFAGSAPVASNDNWGGAANAAQVATTAGQVGAFGLPAGSLDAALLLSLDGGGYSAQVTGAGGAAGIVLVELYDAASATAARLVNVSARAAVGTGESALLAGFTVTGNAKRTVLIRAIGPTLAAFGASGVLADPRLELLASGASAPMGSNDDWGGGANLVGAFAAVGAFPLGATAKDAALLVTLDPGSYSVRVAGVGGTTGEALVEIYEVP